MKSSALPLYDPQPKPTIISLLIRAIQTIIVVVISFVFWPWYVVGRLIWKRPPTVAHLGQARRYLRLTWSVQPPTPGLSWQARVWLTLMIVRKIFMTPMIGVAWFLDELLYGRALSKATIVKPLFVISAGRSGSTQMTRYIEADPTLIAPSMLQTVFPYLWLWRLAGRTIGRIFTPEQIRERLASMVAPELLERHEFDPFKADTFDFALFSANFNPLSGYLGPDVMAQEMNFAVFAPQDKARFERDLVVIVDRIGRKLQLYTGDTKSNTPRRLYIKGHFLNGAEALARHYPDATFLTLIREPAKRIQSGINYLRVNPHDPAIGPTPWAWLAQSVLRTETDYCRIEQEWYTRDDGVRRCVVRFDEFVADLEGTMQHVYATCFDQTELPPHVPREHPPRDRKNYSIDYSLAELGIDAEALRTELADYIAWCAPVGEAGANPKVG